MTDLTERLIAEEAHAQWPEIERITDYLLKETGLQMQEIYDRCSGLEFFPALVFQTIALGFVKFLLTGGVAAKEFVHVAKTRKRPELPGLFAEMTYCVLTETPTSALRRRQAQP